jgi:cell division protein FtsB
MLRMQAIWSALLVTVVLSALATAPYFAFRDDSLDRQIRIQDQISYEDQVAKLRAQIDRMSQLDQERVEEIKSLAEKRATLEQIISGIAKDRLIQARNGLPASGTTGSGPEPSLIETPSAILQVGPAKPEATTNDKKVRLPSRKRAAAVRRQTQEPPTVTANPNASRPEMQNY